MQILQMLIFLAIFSTCVPHFQHFEALEWGILVLDGGGRGRKFSLEGWGVTLALLIGKPHLSGGKYASPENLLP